MKAEVRTRFKPSTWIVIMLSSTNQKLLGLADCLDGAIELITKGAASNSAERSIAIADNGKMFTARYAEGAWYLKEVEITDKEVAEATMADALPATKKARKARNVGSSKKEGLHVKQGPTGKPTVDERSGAEQLGIR